MAHDISERTMHENLTQKEPTGGRGNELLASCGYGGIDGHWGDLWKRDRRRAEGDEDRRAAPLERRAGGRRSDHQEWRGDGCGGGEPGGGSWGGPGRGDLRRG